MWRKRSVEGPCLVRRMSKQWCLLNVLWPLTSSHPTERDSVSRILCTPPFLVWRTPPSSPPLHAAPRRALHIQERTGDMKTEQLVILATIQPKSCYVSKRKPRVETSHSSLLREGGLVMNGELDLLFVLIFRWIWSGDDNYRSAL